MKVEGMSMVVDGDQFDPLSRPLSKSWGATLVPEDEVTEEGTGKGGGQDTGAAVAALALVALPVLFILSRS